jgi:hypothetical protein
VVVAARSRESAPLDPVHRPLKASSTAGSTDRPSLHLREQSSSMKNRKRETCTSGSVRDEDGNILIYSARPAVRFWSQATASWILTASKCFPL